MQRPSYNMQRPTFNVTEFQDVVNVQMNDAMRHLLIDFINEVDQNELEPELRAFRNALRDPDGALERKLRRNYRDDYAPRRHHYNDERPDNYRGHHNESTEGNYRGSDHYEQEERNV